MAVSHQECSDKPPPPENGKANGDNDESKQQSHYCSNNDDSEHFIEIKDNKRRSVTDSYWYLLSFCASRTQSCERVTFLSREFNQIKVCFGDQRLIPAHFAILQEHTGERHNSIAAGGIKRSKKNYILFFLSYCSNKEFSP